MNKLRVSGMIAVMIAVIMIATGCHKNVSAQNQANDLGPDPAAANMAPGDASATPDAQQQPAPAGQGTNEAITAAQSAQPTDQQPVDQNAQDQNAPSDQSAAAPDNSVDYSDAAAQSDQAPPPLPDYDQPPLPGDGYIWTPGYWAWSPDGYYWVPGAWVMPPYEGALWTPGWWGFNDGRYFFFAGYWGPYIGYYGGINYGFGYIGRGYEGGYWRGGHFQYNNSFNVIRIHTANVYTHPVAAPFARVSFNGPGGAHLRPVHAELNAMRQPHRVAPMSTQLQAQRSAQQNRAQFANVNHGRPATVVAPRPITADTRTQSLPPARTPQPRQGSQPNQQPGQQQRPTPQNFQQQRPAAPQQPASQIRQTPQQPQTRPVPQQEQPRQFQMQQPAQRQQQFTPQSRPVPEQQRPENFSRPEQSAPAPQAQPRPEAQPRVEQRPAPQAQPRPAAPAPRPAEQPRQGGGDGHDDHR